jgi:hypothetical protein
MSNYMLFKCNEKPFEPCSSYFGPFDLHGVLLEKTVLSTETLRLDLVS